MAQRIAQEMIPRVETAAGMRFRRPPVVAVRGRDQLRAFLDHKLDDDLPPGELAAQERTYRAFGLIPDTLDLRGLMLDLYTEQVAGFYEPDSAALFVVRGGDPAMLRMIMAHELVHALQDQYTALSPVLKMRRHNDRQMAGQAVFEGQATVVSLMALQPGLTMEQLDGMGDMIRTGIRDQQGSMPVFAAAPLIVREGLIFPYLAGTDFMRGFEQTRRASDEQPFGSRLPVSTEQILHPLAYARRERPAAITFATAARGDTVVYEDNFGEFETRLALQTWGLPDAVATAAAAGWNGDRYRVLGTASGTALVWVSAWDTPQDADDFAVRLRAGWTAWDRRRGGAVRRFEVERTESAGIAVVRLTDAAPDWRGWTRPPAVRVR